MNNSGYTFLFSLLMVIGMPQECWAMITLKNISLEQTYADIPAFVAQYRASTLHDKKEFVSRFSDEEIEKLADAVSDYDRERIIKDYESVGFTQAKREERELGYVDTVDLPACTECGGNYLASNETISVDCDDPIHQSFIQGNRQRFVSLHLRLLCIGEKFKEVRKNIEETHKELENLGKITPLRAFKILGTMAVVSIGVVLLIRWYNSSHNADDRANKE